MIFLGNLTAEALCKRLGVEFSDEDVKWLNDHRQERVNHEELQEGMIHIFDIPFMVMCDAKQTAIMVRDRLSKYDCSKFRESLQVGWEK